VNPFEFLDKFFIPKTRVLGLSVGEDFVIVACVVFTQCQRVTNGRTDGQTDRQTDIPVVASTGLAAMCFYAPQCSTANQLVNFVTKNFIE